MTISFRCWRCGEGARPAQLLLHGSRGLFARRSSSQQGERLWQQHSQPQEQPAGDSISITHRGAVADKHAAARAGPDVPKSHGTVSRAAGHVVAVGVPPHHFHIRLVACCGRRGAEGRKVGYEADCDLIGGAVGRCGAMEKEGKEQRLACLRPLPAAAGCSGPAAHGWPALSTDASLPLKAQPPWVPQAQL